MTSISSVSTAAPVAPLSTAGPKVADKSLQESAASDAANAYQPPPPAPLPPGQGTRVDQLV
jgi:hypothetical protein